MTPPEKAREYLAEFSKEKALDVAETMLCYAKEFEEDGWVYYWERVIAFIKESK